MDGETAGQEGGVTVNDSTSGAAGEPSGLSRKRQSGLLAQYLPILEWGRTYNGSVLTNDLVAAIIVTIMLIPQSLAYALLAGLPPVVGLYASILRSEEHTSELQSLMRISYAVFCLKKKKQYITHHIE